MSKDDIPTWIALAHEGDDIISALIPDIAVFYRGFDDYIKRKIKNNESFMVLDSISDKCLGIAAYSRKNNRITFLGVFREADLEETAGKLLETLLNKLDTHREITVNLIKSDSEMIHRERRLYESFGFAEDTEIIEDGVPAFRMKRVPVMLGS
jgi:hypothetical protein